MIKIRHSLLPEGLHAQARRVGGHTVVYLRPGLSSGQRHEALRRARQTARMGHGPRLPAAGLALALAADRLTATVRNVIAAVRCHPFGTSMLAALVAGAVVSYSLFVTVSVHIIYPQVQGAPPLLPHPAPPAMPGTGNGKPARQSPGATPSAGGSSHAAVAAAPSPGGHRSAGRQGGQPSPARTSQSPRPSPSPSAVSPSPSATAGGGITVGVCVKVGPLGLCLKL